MKLVGLGRVIEKSYLTMGHEEGQTEMPEAAKVTGNQYEVLSSILKCTSLYVYLDARVRSTLKSRIGVGLRISFFLSFLIVQRSV